MAATSEKLQIIIDNKAAIKQAIIEKGGEVGDLTTYADAIANLPSGGGDVNPTAEKNDVTFYDYDGTILYSYTAEEFLALTEMPPLPRQQGLICQEWNWSYEDAIEYVAEYGVLDVGVTYITDDGKTRLYIRIAAEGRMDVPLYFQQTVANGVTIDWGDGSATETLSDTGNVNTTHRYASIGNYVISLDVAEGCELSLGHNTQECCVMGEVGAIYGVRLHKLEIGKGLTSLKNYSLFNCYSMVSVTLPATISELGSYTFQNCYSLKSLIIPNSVTSIGGNAVYDCYSLKSLIIPNSVTSIGFYSFGFCYSLTSIVIPNSVELISGYVLYPNKSRSSLIIPKSVTSIGAGAFADGIGTGYYDFSRHTAVPTLTNVNVFSGIPSDCKIIVPDALYDKWIAATNWSTYASYIIKKTDWNKLQQ